MIRNADTISGNCNIGSRQKVQCAERGTNLLVHEPEASVTEYTGAEEPYEGASRREHPNLQTLAMIELIATNAVSKP